MRVSNASRFEEAFAVFALLIHMGAYTPSVSFVLGTSVTQGASDPISTLGQSTVLCILIVVVAMRRRIVFSTLINARPYLLFLTICFASVLWADNPESTLRRTVVLASCIIFGFYASAVFEPRRLFELIVSATMIAAVGSLVLIVVWPSIGKGLELDGDNLRGVFSHKNGFAENMVFGLISALYLFGSQSRFRFWGILQIVILMTCVIIANSATGLVLSLLMIVLWFVFISHRLAGLQPIIIWLVLGISLVCVLVISVAPDLFFESLGRNATLTGRTEIWAAVIHPLLIRPWFGYGYSSFWGADGAQYVYYIVGWRPPDAHNGYLDVMLQVGVVGLVVCLWIVSSIMLSTIAALHNRNLPEAVWILLVIIFIILHNMVESDLMMPGLLTVLMSFCTTLLIAKRSTGFSRLAHQGLRRPVRQYSVARGVNPKRGEGTF